MTTPLMLVSGYSNSRTIVSNAPVPPSLSWPFKDPADMLDYNIDLGPALNGVAGDNIDAADVEITPSQAGDLFLESITADGFVLILWLSGGVVGVTYVITFNVGTVSGETLGGSISLPVAALSLLSVPVNPITTVTGDPLTDENGSPIKFS
jgi:hypothetical protein